MQGLQDSKRFKTGALAAAITLVVGVLQILVPDVGNRLAGHLDEILLIAMTLMALFGIEDLVLAFKGVPVMPDAPPAEPPPAEPAA